MSIHFLLAGGLQLIVVQGLFFNNFRRIDITNIVYMNLRAIQTKFFNNFFFDDIVYVNLFGRSAGDSICLISW